jgi:hypothetical protein
MGSLENGIGERMGGKDCIDFFKSDFLKKIE